MHPVRIIRACNFIKNIHFMCKSSRIVGILLPVLVVILAKNSVVEDA
jgi:hypothetical protein